MSKAAIKSLGEEVDQFVQGLKVEGNVVPIALGLEVRTVKQEGESSDQCLERAIRASNLVPLNLCICVSGPIQRPTPAVELLRQMNSLKFILKEHEGWAVCRKCPRSMIDCSHGLMKFRVKDPSGPCHLCSKDIRMDDHVSAVPSCKHVFHATCIIKWMHDHTLVCPRCLSPAYDPHRSPKPSFTYFFGEPYYSKWV